MLMASARIGKPQLVLAATVPPRMIRPPSRPSKAREAWRPLEAQREYVYPRLRAQSGKAGTVVEVDIK